ncbi:hypothetical protein [Streptomyces sp. NPDC001315]|uniref:hypothetical protein n=1 Tax=Streptomyces sp. NPDC001315 TaxID=3364562 RepID=UPI0036B40D10
MPRGRHRHSPPLHRLLPPSAIAGVSVVCALAPWVFTQPTMLRVLAAAAAATAVLGAVVMRRWDTQAGKQVADLTRARASDDWRHEERVAELESDLEESRELRVKLEQRLRAKRAELAGLRNEHAALLRRYATAETERATALEGRRLLEIETTAPARALPPAPVPPTAEEAEAVAAPAEAEVVDTEATEEEKPAVPAAVFSPEGSKLFLRAKAALIRFDGEAAAEAPAQSALSPRSADGEPTEDGATSTTGTNDATKVEAAQEDEAQGKPEAVDGHQRAAAEPEAGAEDQIHARNAATGAAVLAETAVETETVMPAESVTPAEIAAPAETVARTEAVAPAETVASAKPAGPVQRPTGHFTVPTAVAVVPAAAPVRRPTVEGGFDFFGMQKSLASAALEAVQNEDLADVVGQEALALHKAEAEAEFKPADAESRGIGQVIDLTAHDETEQIDLQGLRSAAS